MTIIEKMQDISFSPRDIFGKKESRNIRKNGEIPVNIYSKTLKENIHGSIEAKLTEKIYSQGCFFSRLFTLKDEKNGQDYLVFAQDVALHTVNSKIQHIDFMLVKADDIVIRKAPIRVVDQEKSPSLKLGGRVNFINRFITIEVKANEFPEILELSVSGMRAGNVIRAQNLVQENSSYKIVNPDTPILSIIGKKGQTKAQS